MNKKLQIFVSSTFTDRRSERQAAVEAILRAGHIPAGMELFAAGDKSQWETIKSWIDDSDVFMLILGGRYGSIEPTSGKSYVQLEYEYAVEAKKPFFAAVLSEDFLDRKVRESGLDAVEKLNGQLMADFRKMVTDKICRFFGDINELKLIVFESLSYHARNEDLNGWVRGDILVDAKIAMAEMARLQSDNAALRGLVTALENAKSTIINMGQAAATAPPALSADARELVVAAKNGGGYIMYIHTFGGGIVQAGNRNFINPQNDREEARWRAALEELVQRRLVSSSGNKGETFRLTKIGYETADKIEAENKIQSMGVTDHQ